MASALSTIGSTPNRRLLAGQQDSGSTESTMSNTAMPSEGSGKSDKPEGKQIGDYSQMLRSYAKRFTNLFEKRRAAFQDYEKFANENVRSLVGEFSQVAADSFAQAKQLGDSYTENFLPASERYLKDAEAYDTPERRQQERGRAMTDVQVAGDAAREGAIQRLEAFGIDPSQTRGAALDANLRLNTALGQVAAGTEAERSVEERGRAYRSDAIDKGNQLLAGQSALNNTASNMRLGAGNLVNSTTATNVGALDTTANLLRSGTQNTQAAADLKVRNEELDLAAKGAEGGGALGALGSIAGTAAGAYLGSYLGPAGTAAGAQAGAQFGGQAGGGFQTQRVA